MSKALLTAGNPQGDVLFGLDNTFLSRALEGDLFEPYESPLLDRVDGSYVLDPEHRVTPIDHGDVCVNYDKEWFASAEIEPPRSLDDLADERLEGLLVVENPATSTPGLAFLLATIARYGEPGWKDFWRTLREHDVLVVDGWEEAYNSRFTRAAGGNRPIVVSYASSPPAEVIFAKPRPEEAPTAVVADSCFSQIEFAGVLRGARNEEGARELVDFMLSQRFQEDIPLSMFVFPVNREAKLPPEFVKLRGRPRGPARAAAGRDRGQSRQVGEGVDTHRPSLSAGAWRALTYGVPLAFLALFFVFPLVSILERGLGAGGDLAVLTDPLTREVLWFSVWQAVASTALTILVALPASYVLGRYTFRGRGLAFAIVTVPFVLPTVVVALAFLAVLPEGLERGWAAILLAHVFFNVAVVVRIVGTFWAGLDPRVSEAAATLGAGPWRSFRDVTLPLLAPALAAAASIVFLFSFTSFGVVLILGGPRYSTLETEIYNQAVRLFDLRAAAVLALVQLVCVALVVWATTRLEAKLAVSGGRRREGDVLRPLRTRAEKAFAAIALGALALFLGIPLAVLVERSLAVGEGYSLEAYRALTRSTNALLASPWEAIVNSLVYAAGAAVIAVVVGGLAAFAVASSRSGRTRILDGLLLLPLGASAVMLGFGLILAFDTEPLDFRSSPWIVPVAQALVAIPFVVRIVAPTLRAIDERQREAAAVLGASPGRVRREIDLPIAGRALAVAAGFAFAISLGEFGATVFLARPESPTLPVASFASSVVRVSSTWARRTRSP